MIRVSVITAVYNPGAHIDQLIDSLLLQTLPRSEWEVVFVDDDSTDGSRQRLQAFAAGQRNVTVLHNTPNSGWPGRPRNLGLDVARGTYVFFADHDDWLPPDALKRLVSFADKHSSDVVVPKETGHGHTWGWEAFGTTRPRAEIGTDPLWVPPTPHKLFRRSFLAEHAIRFPEGKVRLEDHLVITKAYFAADVVSTYSEHVCYHWVHRDENNASLQRFDPRSYYRDLDGVLDVVAANTESCALTFADRFLTRLALDKVAPTLFEVRGSCADAAVSVFGVPFDVWSLALYVLLAVAGLRVMLRR